jgi:hypothetical protein
MLPVTPGPYTFELPSGGLGSVVMVITAGDLLIALLLFMVVILLFVVTWLIGVRK